MKYEIQRHYDLNVLKNTYELNAGDYWLMSGFSPTDDGWDHVVALSTGKRYVAHVITPTSDILSKPAKFLRNSGMKLDITLSDDFTDAAIQMLRLVEKEHEDR
jgi:hypothetical protein